MIQLTVNNAHSDIDISTPWHSLTWACKELRKQNSLTVHDVVLKLSDKSINVADKTLYGWESGQAQPDADTLLVLCEIYQVDDILSTFGYKENTPINATEYEKKVIFALREHPEMASAVNKLLDIE